jgi:hypothetical protein
MAMVVGAGVTSDGEPVRVRQARRRVAVLDEVVLALLAARVARQPVGLAQLLEARPPSRDDLVHVRLMTGVPQDRVRR